jgi:hypothetical protein
MFDSEAKMSEPVTRWMQSLGLQVKAEFITPWGICDLVGLSFRPRSVAHRRELGQNQPVTSVTRAALLLEIPDEETGESISLRALAKKYAYVMPPDVVDEHTRRLIADKFVIRTPSGQFQKRNGWVPLQKRLVAVELKLHRIEEVMSQGRNNLLFAQESYVALPKDVALRVSAKRARWSHFFDGGVGLLAISPRLCEVVIRSRPPAFSSDDLLQFCSVEKFWRTYPKGS